MNKAKNIVFGVLILLLTSGCAMSPAPGNNNTYRQIQMQEIALPAPKKQPRFISKKSLQKLQSSGDE